MGRNAIGFLACLAALVAGAFLGMATAPLLGIPAEFAEGFAFLVSAAATFCAAVAVMAVFDRLDTRAARQSPRR